MISAKRTIRAIVFKGVCSLAMIFCLALTLFLFVNVVKNSYYGFFKTKILLTVPNSLSYSKYKFFDLVVENNFRDYDRNIIEQVIPSSIKTEADSFFAANNHLQTATLWLNTSGKIDYNYKRKRLHQNEIDIFISDLEAHSGIKKFLNLSFFTKPDSNNPEVAGFKGAIFGSLYTVLIALVIAVPISLVSAIFLEEFTPHNKISSVIEANITNLTSVPSVIYGLLGLAFFINFCHLSRSSILVAGLTLASLLLPFLIVTTRLALKNVPKAIRDASLSLGATRLQMSMGIVVRYASANIITGVLLGLSRVIGETAPLLIIGMASFVGFVPNGIFDSATTMPVQIYNWSSLASESFAEKANLGILVLLLILMLINFVTNYIRSRLEVRL